MPNSLPEAFNYSAKLSIQEAADFLKVSTKTLRRWESQRILIPERTVGNQRRYSLLQLQTFNPKVRKTIPLTHVQAPVVNQTLPITQPEAEIVTDKLIRNNYRIKFLPAGIITALAALVFYSLLTFNNGIKYYQPRGETLSISNSQVLASETALSDLYFRVNIPSSFSKDVIVEGNITAPNIIYSLTAGRGVTITPGQNPTISATGGVSSLQGRNGDLSLVAGTGISVSGLTVTNTDPGSAQSFFSKIKVSGQSDINAGGNKDALEIVAGNNISLTTDASNKKLTINSSSNGIGISSYAIGDILYATTSSQLTTLPIGTAGQILTVVGGIPAWAATSNTCLGSCLGTAPSGTQTIIPVSSTATGLVVSQALGGTVDIFSVTNNSGVIEYLTVDNSGNVSVGNLTTNGVVYTTGGIGTLSSESQLAISRGGTNSSASPTQGGITYGTGTAYAFSSTGSSGQLLQSNGTGAPSWINTSSVNYWQRQAGTLAPLNITDDFLIGGSATSSSKFQIFADSGGASSSGTLTLYGSPPNIQILNGGNFSLQTSPGGNSGLLERLTILNNGNVGINHTTPDESLEINGAIHLDQISAPSPVADKLYNDLGSLYWAGNQVCVDGGSCASTGTVGITGTPSIGQVTFWANSTNVSGNNNFFWNNTNSLFGLGTNIPQHPLQVTGSYSTNALVSLSETGGNDILTASAGATTRLVLSNSGNLTLTSLTSGAVYSNSGLISSEAQLAVTRGGTNSTATPTDGGIAYGDGSAYQFTGAGSVGQILASNGTAAPGWISTSSVNFWQRALGVVSPLETTNDLTIGGDATGSALFRVEGLTGNIYSDGLAEIDTVNVLSDLQTGGSTRVDSSGNLANIGTTQFNTQVYTWPDTQSASSVLQTNGTGTLSWISAASLGTNYWQISSGVVAPLEVTNDLIIGGSATISAQFQVSGLTGTVTLPNTSQLIGDTSFLRSTRGLAFGSNQTYFINTLGQANLGAATVSSTLTLLPLTSGAVFSNNGLISSEAQLAVTRGGTNSTATPTDGGIAYGDGTSYQFTGLGSAGQILQSNGTAAPGWISSSSINFWQNALGVVAPLEVTNDLIIGGNATGSALFRAEGLTGNVVTSGSVTLPNTSQLIGDTSFLRSTRGLAFGSYETYFVNSLGQANLGAATISSTLTLPALSSGAVFSNAGLISSEAQLAVTRGGTNSTATPTDGGIAYGDGTSYQFTSLGSAGQILQSNGTAAPGWISSSSINFWQNALGVVAPLEVTNDLIIGGNATGSALFRAEGLTGNVVTSGSVTLPNTSQLIGDTSFLRSTRGLAFGSNQTYFINTLGQANLGAATVSSTLTLLPLTSGAVFSNNGLISSEAQLAVTRGGTNSTATPTDGGIAYGDGTSYQFTSLGSAGQILQSNGTAAPGWISSSSINFWQNALGVVAPLQVTDDLVIGGTATGSALFQVEGLTGNASMSGILTAGTIRPPTGSLVLQSKTGANSWSNTLGINSSGLDVTGSVLLNTTTPSSTTNRLYNTSGSLYWGSDTVCTSASGCASVGTVLTSGTPLAGQVTFFQDPTHITGSSQFFWDNTNSLFGLGTNVPQHPLQVTGSYSTNALVSLSETGSNDILTASAGATTRLVLSNSGALTLSALSSGAVFSNNGLISSEAQLAVTRGGTNSTATPTDGGIAYGDGTSYQFTGLGSAGQILQSNGTAAPGWISSSSINFWQQNLGTLSPLNITDDFLVGGSSTASAKFQVFADTGSATLSGTLNLSYNGVVGGGLLNNCVSSSSKLLWNSSTNQFECGVDQGSGTGGSKWTELNNLLYPNNANTLSVGVGTTTESNLVGLFTVTGSRIGKTLAVLNETGANDILTASAGGVTRLVLSNSGTLTLSALTSGAVFSNNGLISSEAQLAVTRGGTNSTATPTDGGIAYGDGTSYQFTGLGSAGQILQSNGTAAPGWISSSSINFWQNALGVVAPLEVTNDLIIGGNATGSALFRAEGLTGNVVTSGSVTLPNTSQLIGDTSFLRSTRGLAFGSNQTYFINTLGQANLGAATVSSTLTLLPLTSGAVFSNNGLISSEAQLAVTRGGTNSTATPTDGGIAYGDGTSYQFTGLGSAGQILQSNGTAAPGWISSSSINFWQNALGVVAPLEVTNDLIIGGNATGSALFRAEGLTGNVVTSGSVTLPNTSQLIGDTSFLRSTRGLAFGSNQTYFINTLGQANLGAATVSSTLTLLPLTSGAVFSNNGLISSEAQLAVTRGGTNSTATPTDGGIAYGDGTSYQFTGLGSAGQILQSNGTAAPGWISSSSINFWQNALGVVAPLEVTNDLIIGGNATGSALFRAEGLTGNVVTSGSVTLPNTSQLIGDTSFLRSTRGLAFGSNQTYFINTLGQANLGAATVSSTLTLLPLTSGAVFSNNGLISSEAQLAVTRGGTNSTATPTDGGIAYGDGTSYQFTGLGSAGQILQSNGTAAPGWISSSSINFWQNALGVVAPLEVTNDLIIGGNATGSALFRAEGLTGNVVTSGSVTLPNTSQLIGDTSFLRSTRGLAFGSNQTYFINTLGQANLGAATVSSTLTLLPLTSGAVFSNNGLISSEAQLAVTRGGTNSTATPTDGGIAYGDGTSYQFTSLGSAGQILQSNGTAAPGWISSSSINFWQNALGVVAPLEVTNDLIIGGNATGSALFRAEGLTGNVVTSGSVTLPNTSQLIGDTSFLRSTRGLAFGSNQTYFINTLGQANLGAATVSSTLTLLPLTSGAVFSNNGLISSEAQLAVTRGGTNSTATPTDGGIAYGDGTSYQFTGLGSAGQILQSNGTAAPGWISSSSINFWQNALGVVAPLEVTNDLIIGGNATGSALFRAEGLTGNVVTSGSVTLPNTSQLIGDTSFLRSTRGLAFGSNQTYFINTLGQANLGAATVSSTLTLLPLTSGAVFSNNGLISSEAQLAVTRGGTNSTATPTDGGIAYGDGTSYQFTGLGSAGQILQSNGTAAPGWISSSSINFWQNALGVVAPLEVTNDLIIGGNATGSALFRAEGLTGNVVTSGSVTLPNTSQLIGDTSFLRSTRGLAFGSNQTYFINTLGQANLGAATVSSTLTLLPLTSGAVFSNNGLISSEAQLAVTRGGTNSTATPTDGGIAYGDGTSYQFTGLGSAGQILQSNGTAAPGWISSSSINFWQNALGVVAPLEVTNDLIIGGNATGSALFRAEGLTGNVVTSGSVTLPNTSQLIGDTSFLRSTRGLAFGSNQTYFINTLGQANLGAATVSSTLTLLPLTSGAVFSNNGLISSEAQLAVTRGGTNSTATPTDGGIAYGDGTSYQFTGLGSAGQILQSNGTAAPGWISTSSVNFWQLAQGVMAPLNITNDLAIGGTATGSALFQVEGLTGNTLLSATSYLNWGTTTGSAGYGLRSNSGILQLKNSTGIWTNIASESAAFERAKYDRIVDVNGGGTDTTIAAAITNAPTGGSIFISPGTYSENLTIGKALKIWGAGQGRTTIAGAAGSASITISASVSNVEVHNLTVTNAGTSNHVISTAGSSNNYIVIENITTSGGDRGISLIGAEDAKILNNTITNSNSESIYGYEAYGAIITNNTVLDSSMAGISVSDSSDTIIGHNHIYNWGNSLTYSGIVITRSTTGQYYTIVGNTLDGANSSSQGILIGDGVSDSTITGNVIKNTTRSGIYFGGNNSTRISITGNTITDTAGHAINLNGATNNTIANNIFNNNTAGVLVNNTGANNIIRYNNSGSIAELFSSTSAGGMGIGTATTSSRLEITGGMIGKALSIFNETGDQNILVASASGATKFVIARDGSVQLWDTDSSNYLGLQSPGITANLTYTLPGTIGGENWILQTTTGGVMSWLDPGTLPSSNYWQLVNTNTGLASKNTTQDFFVGGTATGSALFQVEGTTGNATMSGTLTAGIIRPPTGPLALQYKSGANTWANGLTIDNTGRVNLPSLNVSSGVYTDANRNLTSTAPTSGILGFWQRTTNSLAPAFVTDDLNIGATATASAFFNVSGLATTVGNAVSVSATNTTLSSGRLLSLDWSPTSPATASGDLFRINIGNGGDTTGNLLNITSAGSSLFSVSKTAVTSNLPTTFTAVGDVTMAYDLVFGNQTSSNIKTKAPFTLDIGDSYESNNLTMTTYNSGKILMNVVNGTGGVGLGAGISPNGLFDVSGSKVGQALVQLNETGDQNILVASASGSNVFTLDRTGNILLPATAYLNFGTTLGGSGYGFRANSGVMQLRNSAGNWTNISSESAAFERAKYDRIVDANGGGTDTTIAAAITNAPTGGSIFISPGTYTEYVTINKALKLFGSGTGRTVIAGSGASPAVTISNAISNVEIHNLEISNTGTSQDVITLGNNSSSNILLENLNIHGGQACIRVYGIQSRIVNNTIYGCNNEAIAFQSGSDYGIASNNTIYSVGGSAILSHASFENISNNSIYDWGVSSSFFAGIELYGSLSHNSVSGNVLNGNSASNQGISIRDAVDSTITDNTVRNVNNDGLIFYNGTNSRLVIANNILTNTGGFGINMGNSLTTYTTVSNNVFSSNTAGTISNTSGTGNIVEYNNSGSFAKLFASSSAGGFGIGQATPSARLQVEGGMIGKALSIFNETGDQNILVASASGATKFVIARDGSVQLWDTDSSNYLGLQSPGITANLTYTLPGTIGGENWILQTTTGGVMSWLDPGTLPSSNYWQLVNTNTGLASKNTTQDFFVGGTATGSALFQVEGTTGNATMSGTLTAGIIRPPTGPLALQYKSGANTWANGLTIDNTGRVNLPSLNVSSGVYTDANRNLTSTAPTSGILGFWQRTTNSLAPAFVTDDLNIGATATASAFFNVSGLATTVGNAVSVSATNTTLSSGRLLSLDWSPTSPATASGDLFRINIGNGGDTTGNLLNITSAGSSLFSVSKTAVTSNLPTSFTAVGDVTMAYDLIFDNQTSSNIKTKAPFTIDVGDNYESNDLTLKTYNAGQIIADTTGTGGFSVTSTGTAGVGLLSVNGAAIGQALVQLNETGDQNILTASASGTTVFNLDRSGNASMSGSLILGYGSSVRPAYGPLALQYKSGANTWANGLTIDNTGAVSLVNNLFAAGGVSTYDTTVTDGYGEFSGLCLGNGTGCITSWGSAGLNYWQLSLGAVAPSEVTNDLLVGGSATTSALFRVEGLTGNATMSGTLTAGIIRPPTGPLALQYKSGANTWANGLTIDNTGRVNLPSLNVSSGVYTDANRNLTSTAPTSGILGFWQRTTNSLAPAFVTDDLNIGATATASAFFNVSGLATTVGNAVSVSATNTTLSSGRLLSLDWSPTSPATASGDLFRINIGNGGDTTGNLLNITSAGSSLFSVSKTAVTSNLPTSFTSAGDVTFGYDAVFTNQTSSQILSYGPFSVIAGESYESNNLTFKTYNAGQVIADTSGTGGFSVTSTGAAGTGLFSVNGAGIGKALVQLNETGDQNILVASASGATKFVVARNGSVQLWDTDSSNYLGLQSPGITANLTYTLPGTIGGENWILQTTTGGVMSWLDPGTLPSSNYWQLVNTNTGLASKNTTQDFFVGGTATGSALFQVEGTTGNATMSGTLTAGIIRPPTGPLALQYKSGANTWANGLTIDNTGRVNLPSLNVSSGVYTDANRNLTSTAPTSGILGFWQRTTNSLAPAFVTDDLNIGATATASAFFNVSGLATTVGNAVSVSATNTTLSSGRLLSLDWSPTSPATASGDLFRINIGNGGDTTGNLLNITSAGSSLFSVSKTAVTSNLPTSFTSAGDVSMAYDLIMTNLTSSNIKTSAPLTIDVGENYSSNNLTLRTYNSGRIIGDVSGTGGMTVSSNVSGVTPQSLFQVDGAAVGQALVVLNETGDQNILTASASGTTVFNLDRSGNASMSGSLILGYGSSVRPAYGPLALQYKSGANTWANGLVIDNAGNVTLGNSTTVTVQTGGNQNMTLSAGTGLVNISSNASASGDLTMGYGKVIKPAYGPLTLQYKSAANTWANGLTIDNTGRVNLPSLNVSSGVYTDANRNLTSTAPTSGLLGFWQRTTNSLAPAFVTDDLNIGATATASAFLNIAGTTVTTGNLMTMNANSVTTGNGFVVSGTGTTLSSGRLLSLDWSPTSPATASGDLFRINIGNGGDTTGNLLNITSAGSSLFSVSKTAVTSNLPTSFNSSGDVSMAYDLLFTNPTASNIKSDAPLTVEAGPSYASNNLTLKSYNSGNLVVDLTSGSILPATDATINIGATSSSRFKDLYLSGQVYAGGSLIMGDNSIYQDQGNLVIYTNQNGAKTAAMTINNVGQVVYGTTAAIGKFDIIGTQPGKSLTVLNSTTTDQNIMTASASGATVMNLDATGNLSLYNQADLRLYDSGSSNYLAIQAPALTADLTYTLPATVSDTYILQTNGTGTLTWIDPGTLPSSNYWRILNGVITPLNSTYDVALGGNATTSAKLLVNGGNIGGKASVIINQTENTDVLAASASGANVFRISNTGLLTATPTSTGTILNVPLATAWTSGTIINGAYAASTTQAGNIYGVALDFSTNLTAATTRNITGFTLSLPALTQTAANTTSYTGFTIPTAGALVQNTAAGVINWTGIDLTLPATTQTTGTVAVNAIKITGSNTAAAVNGTTNALNVAGASIIQTAKNPLYVGGIDSGANGTNQIEISGRYAFVGAASNAGTCNATTKTGCELQIYDIINPASPAYVGGADTGNNMVYDVKVVGQYAYLTLYNNNGTCNSTTKTGCEFQIYNIANISAPTYVGGADNGGGSTDSSNTISISGRYAYIGKDGNSGTCSSSTNTGCELQVYDISNPQNPTYVGGANTGNYYVMSIDIQGQYLYLGRAGNNGTCTTGTLTGCEIQVWNISNPTVPVISAVQDASYGGSASSDNIDVLKISGRYLYIGKSGIAGSCTGGDYTGCELQVWDVSNPTSLAPIAGFDNGDNIVYGLQLTGRYLYVMNTAAAGTCSSATKDGCEIQVWDVSTPSAPSYVGGADNGGNQGSTVTVAGRYLYSSMVANAGTCSASTNTGCELQVYDLSGMETNALLANSLETGSIYARGNAIFNKTVTVQSGLLVGTNGIFTSGMATLGNLNVQNDATKVLGKAAAIINQTENTDIFTASASGSTVLSLSSTGNLTLGRASGLTGSLVLANSGSAYTTTIQAGNNITASRTYILPTDMGSNNQVLSISNNTTGQLAWTTATGGTNYWQLNSQQLSAVNTTYDLLAGSTATASAYFAALGTATVTGNAVAINANSLTTGIGLNISDTGTVLTSGRLAYLNWSPTAPATASGDLFRINMGNGGDTTGNLFNVTYAGADSLFSVSRTAVTSNLPTSFTAAGDTSMAYDLVMTNQTAANINSNGPLSINAGEAFESNNLTLKTFNSGNIVFDTAENGKVLIGTGSATLKFTVSDSQAATAAAMIENTYNGNNADGLAIKLGYTGNGATSNRFITFINGSSVNVGRIEATTGLGVAYQTAGADFAEYFVKDNVTFTGGDIVTQKAGGAVKSSQAYDPGMLGIVSTQPGFKGGDDAPDKVLVGLVGQLPLKISLQSDSIQAGDALTSSSDPGRAIKATLSGPIIGKALEAWTPDSGKDQILVYVNPTWADPNHSVSFDAKGNLNLGNFTVQNSPNKLTFVNNASPNLSLMSLSESGKLVTLSASVVGTPDVAENIPVSDQTIEAGDIVAIDKHAVGDGSAYDNFKAKKASLTDGSGILGVISQKPGIVIHASEDALQTDNVSNPDNRLLSLIGRILVKVSDTSDPITAGDYLTVSTDPGKAAKSINSGFVIGKALENWQPNSGKHQVLFLIEQGYHNGLTSNAISKALEGDNTDLAKFINTQFDTRLDFVQIADDKLVLKAYDGSDSASIDRNGNATFSGILTADTIQANHITGLEDINNRLALLDSQMTELASGSAQIQTATPSAVLTLTDLENLALSGNLIVRGETEFIGRAYFNADTAGYAVVKEGADEVQINFTNPYPIAPIVNATITTDDNPILEQLLLTSGVRYIITRRTATGFVIKLTSPATQDVPFSWTAAAIKNPVTSVSLPTILGDSIATPSAQASPSATPTPLP